MNTPAFGEKFLEELTKVPMELLRTAAVLRSFDLPFLQAVHGRTRCTYEDYADLTALSFVGKTGLPGQWYVHEPVQHSLRWNFWQDDYVGYRKVCQAAYLAAYVDYVAEGAQAGISYWNRKIDAAYYHLAGDPEQGPDYYIDTADLLGDRTDHLEALFWAGRDHMLAGRIIGMEGRRAVQHCRQLLVDRRFPL